jgi:hypothetical protein
MIQPTPGHCSGGIMVVLISLTILDKDRYGYQMLEKMGWANGKGLGRNKSGSTSNIKIKKRKQNLGV